MRGGVVAAEGDGEDRPEHCESSSAGGAAGEQAARRTQPRLCGFISGRTLELLRTHDGKG
jgi:hypothetical protein